MAAAIVVIVLCYINYGIAVYTSPYYAKVQYHNSALSGHAWLQELLLGHPDRIHMELGVRHHVFWALCLELRLFGAEDTPHITLEESLAIFLYLIWTGLSVHHVGE
ncbi:hypothetical protein F5890DRAFT_1422155 [Lentinula detonsa]|uniref:DUF8040 domain-containing protein n=1 Tax=Lentinula detonsa TaxID=2804962 RepID=A0AA38UPB0_9AGAR|nr:hypothetical protein F5890DRAFT_1422155 [Lentinula detonsa]